MIRGILVVGALTVIASGAAAQETKVGYVDTRRIESESVPFVRAMDALKKEFAPREKQIVDLQKQISADKERFEKERDKLPAAEAQSRANAITAMMRKSDQMAYAMADDLDKRKQERLGKLIEEVNGAIKAVAEAGKFDLILQQATYARSGIDITDQVLKELARRSGGKP